MLTSDRELLYRVVEIEKLRQKRFFITGATGFFGLNFLEALSELNQKFKLDLEITLLVRDQKRAEQLFSKFGIFLDSIRFLESDLLGFSAVKFNHSKYDAVFHLAANTNLQLLKDQPEVERQAIVAGTAQVLDMAESLGCKNFVYLSSGAVYGKQPPEILKFKEGDSLAHQALESDVYGSSKVIAEQECIKRSVKSNLKLTIFRGFAFGGPHLKLDAHYAIGNLLQSAMAGGPIIVNEGSTQRSYLNCMDAVVWMLKAVLNDHPSKVFNMGSDQMVTIEQLAQKISEKTGNKNLQILNRSETPNRYVPNIDLAKKELGVDVYTSLDQMIHNMIEWNS